MFRSTPCIAITEYHILRHTNRIIVTMTGLDLPRYTQRVDSPCHQYTVEPPILNSSKIKGHSIINLSIIDMTYGPRIIIPEIYFKPPVEETSLQRTNQLNFPKCPLFRGSSLQCFSVVSKVQSNLLSKYLG